MASDLQFAGIPKENLLVIMDKNTVIFLGLRPDPFEKIQGARVIHSTLPTCLVYDMKLADAPNGYEMKLPPSENNGIYNIVLKPKENRDS